MNIAIVGTGYVGLASGTFIAEMGVNVICVDVDVMDGRDIYDKWELEQEQMPLLSIEK